MKDRNDQLAEKRDLMIDLDPEIAAAFGNSANISSKYIFQSLLQSTLILVFIRIDSNQGQRCTHSQGRKQEEENIGHDA